MKIRNLLRPAHLLGLTLALSLAGCGGGDVANVDGRAVTRADFEHRLGALPVARQVLNQLIQSALIDEYAAKHGITIPSGAVDVKLAELEGRYPPGQFEAIVHQQGLSIDDIRGILQRQLILQRAVDHDVHVKESDIAAAFAKNHALYDQAEQVRAKHILVADLATAQMIEGKLKAGAKFDDLAKTYSTDPSSKAHGGDLGYFGRHQMVQSFEDAAFSQPIGVPGPPVKSPFGYHIIEVTDRKAAKPATLASAHDQIRKQLMQQQEATLVPGFLQKLQSQAKIRILDPQLQGASANLGG